MTLTKARIVDRIVEQNGVPHKVAYELVYR